MESATHEVGLSQKNNEISGVDIESSPRSSIFLKKTPTSSMDEDEFEDNCPSRVDHRREKIDLDEEVAFRLAHRAAHLPGNNWCQDWAQFMLNNHPVFGICLRDGRHPLGSVDRFVILIGSLAFGVAATNSIYMYYG